MIEFSGMRAVLRREISWLIAALMMCGLLNPVARATDESGDSPEVRLKNLDLRRSGSAFVLNDEARLSQMMSQTNRMKRQLNDSGKALTAAERQSLLKKQTLAQLRVQHVDLSARLANVRTVEENNRLVGVLNAIAGQIELATQDQTVENQLKEARVKANEVRETYAQHVIDMRALYDSLRERYSELQDDVDVKQALDELNRGADKPAELGPSRSFSSIERQLVKIEETILSEDIVARIGDGSLLFVSAVFNGSEAIEIAVDTGASSVVLPWDVSEKLGLKPGPDSPRAIFVMADGRQSEGRIVRAKSVRVGKFIQEDVECAVLAPENTNAIPLLGQSFLEHFNYRIDSAKGTISITRVEDGGSGRTGSGRQK